MAFALPPTPALLLSLAALMLLPGLLVVRAPWTAVPFLSVAFWVVSWWWPLAGGSRARFLGATLVACLVLASLRLLPRRAASASAGERRAGARREPPALGNGASLAVLLVALVLVVLGCVDPGRHAPGREGAFQSMSGFLLLWRDGLPATYAPLAALEPFGAHPPASACLGADLACLSGVAVVPSLAAAWRTSWALLVLALFALYATAIRPRAAALAALAGSSILAWLPQMGALLLGATGTEGGWLTSGDPVLGLALGASAAALLLGHRSRASAVTGGLLLAASTLAHPAIALGSAGLSAALARRLQGPEAWRRLAVAFVFASALLVPFLARLLRALALDEIGGWGAPTLLAGVLVVVLGMLPLLTDRLLEAGPRLLAPALGVALAGLLIAGIERTFEENQLDSGSRARLLHLRSVTKPLDAVCAPDGVGEWVPALAERAVSGGTWVPPVFRQEAGRTPPRPCAADWDGDSAGP